MSWWRPAAGLALCAAMTAGCASGDGAATETIAGFPTRITRPVKYRLAGADPQLRRNLERAEKDLEARRYQRAVTSLNRAVWDLEGIDKRSLRLTELAAVYEALARANAGLGNPDLAAEQHRMALALRDATGREESATPIAKLVRGKKAYLAAQFGEALRLLRQALIELEDADYAEVRIIYLVETRCYLSFTYFAAQDHGRVRDELSRLWAHDASMAVCRRDAPPGVRPLILEIQRGVDS
jgi:tetratricopeptide (TPR) repeat protein